MVEKKKVIVAIASDFLTSFSKIPRRQQGKVLEFINNFRSNPLMPGINYEKIRRCRDPNLRSVRIDQSYRGIVLKPEKGNIFMLLWVDHHDRAYRWAKNKMVKIHPETGSIQIFDVEVSGDKVPEQIGGTDKYRLFADVSDRDLLKLGVPLQLLPLVRNIKTVDELDQLADYFPEEAYEALFFLSEGFSLDEIYEEMAAAEKPERIDLEDYERALQNLDSKRRFFVVENELELIEILSAPLEKWRIFLHPSQRKLVEREWNGPVRVLGGAGAGKTVVAMHRAKWLAQNVFKGNDDKILFTTFTKNLAADIQENLNKLCRRDVLRRIEVVNLDKWVSNFLRRNGYNFEIDYGHKTTPLWEEALNLAPAELGFSDSFYREEWKRVIQPQSIMSLNEYLKASRLGRGVRLSRKHRKTIWPVFEEYRVLLDANGLREPDDAMRDARFILKNKGDILPYRAIIVDEAQDMGVQALRLIRQMIPGEGSKNDIFIVGDAHQRIYRHRVVLSHCGINIRGRSRKLRINYRTTDETRRWAVSLLKGINIDDLDGGTDDQKGYKSLLHGVEPVVQNFGSFDDEVDFIANYLRQLDTRGESLKGVCLVARTNELIRQYESALKERGIGTYFIRRSEAEDRNAPGVRLATMHRVKGLEFDQVIIAGVNEGIVPLATLLKDASDPVVKAESEVQERALLYVSATRAKKEVVVTSFGEPSKFLQDLR